MTRYTFQFISTYQGETDYRIWRDGKDDGRLRIRGRKVFYSDSSPALRCEVLALNAYLESQHAAAIARYPDLDIPAFEPLDC